MLGKKKLLIIAGAILIVGVGVLVYFRATTNTATDKDTATSVNVSAHNEPAESGEIKLIATGDWIAHDSVNTAARTTNGAYDYMAMIKDFVPVFKAADIRFCNDPILNGGQSLGISGYPKFNSPTEFVTAMGKLGCNLVNLASNHSFDFSQTNISNSVSAWQQTPGVLAFAGENQNQLQHDQIRLFSVKGVKFAFLAYTTYLNTDAPAQNSYGVNVFSHTFAQQQINEAKADGARFIIASMRWGSEYSNTLTTEEQQDAQWLADQGVKLVLGHGTHVLQPVQWLNGRDDQKTLVWYGLGDFLHSQIPADTVFNGIASMTISPKTLAVTSLGFLPIYMHYDWTSQQAAAQDLAARTDLHLYLLQDTTQSMINAQQLNTTVAAQKQRMDATLTSYNAKVPLLTLSQYYSQ